jgi:hypothetical protein
MKPARLLIALLACVAAFNLSCVPKNTEETVREEKKGQSLFSPERQKFFAYLDAYDTSSSKVELFEMLSEKLAKTDDQNERAYYADWLAEKSITDAESFRYPAFAAFYNKKLGDEQKASEFALYAILMERIDYRRCLYPNRLAGKFQNWFQSILASKALDYYLAQPVEKREKLLQAAIDLEDRHRDRSGDNWLCSSIDYTKYLNSLSESEKAAFEKSLNEGRGITVKGGEQFRISGFIEDQQWHKKREKIAGEFKEVFKKWDQ